ncbi:MAG: ABC transporter ATP-binding protein [Patescibacteria group bacterium]
MKETTQKSVPALEITDLTKRYEKATAVDKLTLTVQQGEFFGFLGPNGAGKSSTIHCITGIAKITSGSIRVFGYDVETNYRIARAQIGLAPQEFNMDIFAPTWKILDYVAGYYGMPSEERKIRIDELLERFELKKHRDKQFRELSGGLKRRVMLARAMVHNPKLLILDEPTAGVDVELRHELWNYLRELNKEGKTIILTSHYLEEVELLCERVAIINQGTIVADQSMAAYTKGGKRLEETYLKLTKGLHA